MKLMIRKKEVKQPRPVFFTEEQIRRMDKTKGSYQYGKETESQ